MTSKTMNKSTPGPWLVCRERPDEILMDDSKGDEVFALVAMVHTDSCEPDQWQADARLIAAAPDMADVPRRGGLRVNEDAPSE